MSQTVAEHETNRGFRPFARTQEALREDFHHPEYVSGLPESPKAHRVALISMLSDDFALAWGGRDAACTEAPEFCPDATELGYYAAWFALGFAALGASLEETVRLTLDLHDALDREYHTAEDATFLAGLHFAAVHPDRLSPEEIA